MALKSWIGKNGGDWFTGSNWSSGSDPTAGDLAVITTNAPDVGIAGTFQDFTLVLGGTVGSGAGLVTTDRTFNTGITLSSLNQEATFTAKGMTENAGSFNFLSQTNHFTIHVDGYTAGGGTFHAGQFLNSGTIQVGLGNVVTFDTTSSPAGIFLNTPTGSISVSNAGELHFDIAYSTFRGALSMASHATVDFDAASNASVDFLDGTSNLLSLGQPAAFTGFISGFQGSDQLQLEGVDPTGALSYKAGILTVPTSAGTFNYVVSTPYATPTFTATDTGNDLLIGVFCFVAGALIATADGDVAVELLREGDMLATHTEDGVVFRRLKWVGHRRLDITRHPDPDSVTPIRIRRGAFAQDVPVRDLLLSPDHAIYVDGRLIVARQLVNEASIIRDTTLRTVHYVHLELDEHAILFAEGLTAESYLDTGNRGLFHNADTPLVLHPDLAAAQTFREQRSVAPFAGPAEIEPQWRRLAGRATRMGYPPFAPAVTTEPDLRLIANGRVLRPSVVTSNEYAFVLPPDTRSLQLLSRSAAPNMTRPWLEDRRRLGVAIGRISILGPDGDSEPLDLAMDHPALSEGWWAAERFDGQIVRWTTGAATIPIAWQGASVLRLRVVACSTYRLDDGTVRADAPHSRIAAA